MQSNDSYISLDIDIINESLAKFTLIYLMNYIADGSTLMGWAPQALGRKLVTSIFFSIIRSQEVTNCDTHLWCLRYIFLANKEGKKIEFTKHKLF